MMLILKLQAVVFSVLYFVILKLCIIFGQSQICNCLDTMNTFNVGGFLVLFLVSIGVQSCGISTHTEIGFRALEFLGLSEDPDVQHIRDILLKHQDAFQAGHPYPDSFYNSLCYHGQYHEQSEDTHWGHFVKVAFDFVNSKYPAPWDADTERLVAFLFGIISHQVADISWHSLEGLSDGFLEVLSKLGFHNNFGAAHDFGDVADDMIGIFEWNVTSYATEWYVPVQDLVEIYEVRVLT